MNQFTLALPSKGAIAEPTYNFLKNCGMKVSKPNPRQYTGHIGSLDNLQVLFQRVKDVMYKVADGTAQLGITGLDVVYENPHPDVVVIHGKLNYGHCQLVVAVPESWIDVNSMDDLVDVALDFREKKGRNLRVATTYTHQTRQFFQKQHIHHFTMVRAEGAIEAAPTIGYADIIVDLTQTGTTLRENHLKQIQGGTIVEAQACLIGNKRAIKENPELLSTIQTMTELMDASLMGRKYYQIMVDIAGDSPQEIAERLQNQSSTHGMLAPTISEMYTQTENNERYFTATLIVPTNNLIDAVNQLRELGAKQTFVSPIKFVFQQELSTFNQLLEQLN